MTNQNDTQDEAEARKVIEAVLSKMRGDRSFNIKVLDVFFEKGRQLGFAAGQASKEPEIASLKHDLATKSSTDLISEKYRLREQLADSRAEVERLKAQVQCYYNSENAAIRDLREQLTAEKAKAQKLVEALEIYLDDLSSGPKLSKVTDALRDYSTDSGDGVG